MQNGSDSQDMLRQVLAQYEQEYSGSGRSLEDALEDAYENGKASGKHVFKVNHIFITGDNPLSGYGVVISPSG